MGTYGRFPPCVHGADGGLLGCLAPSAQVALAGKPSEHDAMPSAVRIALGLVA